MAHVTGFQTLPLLILSTCVLCSTIEPILQNSVSTSETRNGKTLRFEPETSQVKTSEPIEQIVPDPKENQDRESQSMENSGSQNTYDSQREYEEILATLMSRVPNLPEFSPANLTCDVCKGLVKDLQNLLKKAKPADFILRAVVEMCRKMKLQEESVCAMIVNEMKDVALYVFTHGDLMPEQVCGRVLGAPCPYYDGPWWNVTIPNRREPGPSASIPPKSHHPAKTLRVLQISDLHLDFQYREGTVVYCDLPMCCRVFNATKSDVTKAIKGQGHTPLAGKYGAVASCDLANSTILSLFQHLANVKDDIDYVMFIGDVNSHDVWNQTKQQSIDHYTYLDNLFKTYLPDLPVYYTLGNHEVIPVDMLPPPGIPEFPNDWLLGPLSEIWGRWLDTGSRESILKCGSYSYSPYPGFRIVSLNNVYCTGDNLFLLLNVTDPCDSLQWMVGELQRAEERGERVHVLTHIPNDECLKPWSWNFYRIISRYSSTITNIFHGHTHHDSYQMFYDDATLQRPVAVGFIAPSVTTFSGHHAAYRIYTVDTSQWSVVDYDNFYLNVTKANELGVATWEKQYNVQTEYKMRGLRPEDFEKLLHKMKWHFATFQKFYNNFNALAPSPECNYKCREYVLCNVKRARSSDPDICEIHK